MTKRLLLGGTACLLALVLLTVLLASMDAGVSGAESAVLLVIVFIGGASVVAACRMRSRQGAWDLNPHPTRTRVELLAAAVLSVGLVALLVGVLAMVVMVLGLAN